MKPPKKDRKVIDLSGSFDIGEPFQLQFVFVGFLYYWIIDDLGIYSGYPNPETFPEYIGDSLYTFGIDYDVDCAGTPIVPHQLVVQFSPGHYRYGKART